MQSQELGTPMAKAGALILDEASEYAHCKKEDRGGIGSLLQHPG